MKTKIAKVMILCAALGFGSGCDTSARFLGGNAAVSIVASVAGTLGAALSHAIGPTLGLPAETDDGPDAM